MEFGAQLSFLQQLLKRMNVSSCIIEDPEKGIPPQIDLGLRADLFSLDDYYPFLQNSMAEAKDNTIYLFFDEYDCKYIFLRLPEKADKYFFIGPYLLEMPSPVNIRRKASSLGLTEEKIGRMQLYYSDLPVVEDENLLLTMLNTLASYLWKEPEQYAVEYVEYAIPDRYEPIPYHALGCQNFENNLSLDVLERNYANENQLIDAVSKGKLHLVSAVASTVFNNGTQNRTADSLRDRKNYLVILKTLLRKAAEYGGVHPLHIHRLSSYYADSIESVRSIRQSLTLQEEMIRDFCQLVKQHSLSQYSYYVGQTIVMVQYDLSTDLRLSTIAEKLNVNPSYLSGLFHREYGCTLTDFINKQRIDQGITLLRTTSKSVQAIAAECGIQDVNYFIKLFKKQTGFTPKKYRDMINSPESQK